MKIRTLAVAAGVSAPLILSGSASGGFVEVTSTSKPNAFGLLVVNVYAVFDRPGQDAVVAVAGTPATPLLIQVTGGTFYNHSFGNDNAPNPLLIDAFPSLAFDSFVTIGKKVSTGNQLTITPGFPGVSGSQLATDGSGWAVTPNNPQGNPFDAVNCFPGDGRVLIGQFSTANGTSIQGTMYLQYRINGVYENSVGSFQHPPAQPCPWDCGDNDGTVGIVDFLAMLAQWGTPGSCDSDGDGAVGIVDFLALKGHWGPCP